MKEIFQIDSEIVKESYCRENYKISYNDLADKNICAIYFSSNNIYYPNNEDVFIKNIVKNDRYEWTEKPFENAYKNIFIRDIKKQWYVEGINNEINTIDAVIEFLKKETDGYKTYWIGSSAGGYMAKLLGSILDGEKIFSFNGQTELFSLLETSSYEVDPLIFKYSTQKRSKYFSLVKYVQHKQNINYFCSIKSDWDRRQLEHVCKTRINSIKFNSSKHGVPFLNSSLEDVMKLNKSEILNLMDKVHNPLIFSIRMSGLRKSLVGLIRTLIKIVKRRSK